MIRFLQGAILLLLMSCHQQKPSSESVVINAENKLKVDRNVEILLPELKNIVNPDAEIEIIAEGLEWSEGPLWLPGQQMLIFSDIPANIIYKWSESKGVQTYLSPSGYTGQQPRGGETGSNGLLLDKEGRLVLCQHGDRRIARMDASLNDPKPKFITLTDRFKGQKYNSPNDAIYRSNGDLYFTDPPYGLEKKMADHAKEIPFQGVYRLTNKGEVQLLTKELSRPNGIAFSPDEKTLYVANSDPKRALWMAYDLNEDGGIANGHVFFDATELAKQAKGLPDGLKVLDSGILFATGPGGVLIFNSEGRHLGTIKTGEATSNCAFNEDESILYITTDNYVMRVELGGFSAGND